MTELDSSRRSSPAALRNRDPILDVLRTALPHHGVVLEIASGSGEHVLHFARHLPGLIWQPSDPSPEARASIASWLDASPHKNIRAPLDLDASVPTWPIEHADAIVAINMVHISPWEATMGLFAGASQLLSSGALLILYGPYRQEGRAFAPSNTAFDRDHRARNSDWGVRDLHDIEEVAERGRLQLESVIDMPANNLMLLFRSA